MLRQRCEDFVDDFLHAVDPVPDKCTLQQIQDTHIDRKKEETSKT